MTAQPALQQSGFKQATCELVSHRTRTWRLARADLVERGNLRREETSMVSDRHLVLLNLKGASEQGQYRLDGRNAEFVRRKPGAVLFIPAGCHWQGWEAGASNAAYLSITVQPALVEKLSMEMSGGVLPTLSPDLGFEDPIITNAAQGIAAEIDDRNPVSTMLTESYIATIFAQLARKQKFVTPAHKGGLSRGNLNRVIELIDEDPTAELSLTQLADHIGVSVPHFCRAFRQSVGCSPHTFIMHRRIKQAQDQLRDTRTPITDIALSCGFSSSSHFSNTFKRLIGVTPVEYRQRWPI